MRYIVGIDLGTTNSCISYIDLEKSLHQLHPFAIPQLKEAGYVEEQPTLPSFCYLTFPHEWPAGSLDLPWKRDPDFFVGSFALAHGGKVPTRLVQSAKSWLSHTGTNRRDKILPFEANDPSIRITPVEASARYLSHIKHAWNYKMAAGDPEAELQQQEIILTVPASFDEVARALTAEAARAAGFLHMTLLEEPQAAFYSWISHHEKNWEQQITPGASILVCDVGGGTTDFSLIEVVEKEGRLSFQRMAVGNHLLLGGDNMDAAIAHFLETKRREQGHPECTAHQWLQLRHEARLAKETLLEERGEKTYRVHLQGTGSNVIQGSTLIEISRSEVETLLEQGFFALLPWEEATQLLKGSAIRSMGLPYEEDPSIIKQMAAFLHACGKRPDYLLFNGGAMKPSSFQNRITEALRLWFPEKKISILKSGSLDLSVSRGAAYYGKARRGEGVRIGGGAPRGYYLGVSIKGEEKALTLLPRGSEEGSSYESPMTFWLTPNTPVSFCLYSSHVRLHDEPGSFLEIVPGEFHPMPQIHTLLRVGKGTVTEVSKEKIPVHISITLTAIGTLEIWLRAQKSNHKWNLEFQLRTATGQENSLALVERNRHDETFDATYLDAPRTLIRDLYSGDGRVKPGKIMELLENRLERARTEWAPSLLRGLWEEVSQQSSRRKASQELEARWWNLAGFLLRPGIGYPLDDFRMKELWKVILADLKANRPLEAQIQSWICYRRIAGGLNKGQQMQLVNELWKGGKLEIKNNSELYQYQERVRALAALELIDVNIKIKLGTMILDRMKKGTSTQAETWALGRVGARHLMQGGALHVVPATVCAQWVEQLLEMNCLDPFILGQLARKTDQRELNLPTEVVERVRKQTSQLEKILFKEIPLTLPEQEQIYGERLPLGISLEN